MKIDHEAGAQDEGAARERDVRAWKRRRKGSYPLDVADTYREGWEAGARHARQQRAAAPQDADVEGVLAQVWTRFQTAVADGRTDTADALLAAHALLTRLAREKDEASAGWAKALDDCVQIESKYRTRAERAEADAARLRAAILKVAEVQGWSSDHPCLAALAKLEADND